MSNGSWAHWATLIAVAVALLGAANPGSAQEPPDPPTDEELDGAIFAHHPDLMDRPLGEGLQVWFVLDSDGNPVTRSINMENLFSVQPEVFIRNDPYL